jgi:DNA-binding NarL/FixJ family response regulator
MNKVRILLADDHAEFSSAVQSLLEQDFDVIGKVADGEALVAAAMQLHPDVIVTDISMPNLNGIEAAQKLRQLGVAAKIVFLTMHQGHDFVDACLHAGASGYILKTGLAELVPALHRVIAGRTFVATPDALAN